MAELLEKVVATATADVTVTLTTETVILASGPAKIPTQTALVKVRAWCQFTTGTGATTVTPRLRRGNSAAGALVGEANAETLKAAAGGTEPFVMEAIEGRSNEDTVEYCLTLQQAGATGNGTVLQAAIAVEVLSG